MITLSPDLFCQEQQGFTLLAATLDQLTDGVVWINTDAQIKGYNSAFCQFIYCLHQPCKTCLSSLVGLSLWDILPLSQAGDYLTFQSIPELLFKTDLKQPQEYEIERGGRTLTLKVCFHSITEGLEPIIVLIIQDITLIKQLEIEYQQKENSLRQTEEVLRATLEATADGILVVNKTCDIPIYNQKFVQMWSIPEALMQPNQGKKRAWFAAEQTVAPEEFMAKIQNLFVQDHETTVLDVIELKDGRVFQRYSQPQWHDNKIIGRVFSFRDITQQKRIEKSLRENEERLRTLINATPDIICFKDGEGRWLESNQANLEFLKLEGISYQGKTDAELAELRPFYREALLSCQISDEEAWQKGRIHRVEERVSKPDGSLMIFDMIKVPLFDPEGRRTGLVVLGRDISKKKQAEEALRRSELKYRSLFENSQVGIYRLRLEDGLILEANQRLLQLIGSNNPEEIIGKRSSSEFYVNASDRQEVLNYLHEQGEHRDYEVLWHQPNGNIIWGLCSARINQEENCIDGVIIDISDRKRTEEALKLSEAKYRDLVETANCIILRWDTSGNIRFINDYGKEFLGFKENEILGKNVVGNIVPETETSGRDLQFLMEDICQHPENYLLNENENICKNGQRVWVVWANKPIFNEKGELVEILSVGTDATERQHAQKALEHSLSLQQATFESIQDGILAVDNNTNIVSCNQAFLEMWSITDQVLDEHSHDQRIQYIANQVKDTQEFFQRVKQLYATPELQSYDLLELKDGRVFERYSCPQRLGEKIIGRVWSFRDLTDQKRAEADLQASEEKFRRIVETAHDIIYLMNQDGELIYVAPNILMIMGYAPFELEGKSFTPFIHPDDLPKCIAAFQRLITTEDRQFDIEYRVKHKDGTWNWYSGNWAVSQDAQGYLLVVGVSRNINERRRLENEFISLVSHELRTPLTSLMGGLDLLASGKLGTLTQQGEKLLTIAISNTERLIRLVNNILDLERIKSSKIVMQKLSCNIADLLMKAQDEMQALADQSQIKLVVNSSSYLIEVDPDRILQTLTNLLSNAIKFSEAGQMIWMTTDLIKSPEQFPNLMVEYPCICLCVKDQGRGIPANKLHKIFERFEQVDASDSRTKGGTGLGLAICRNIVEQHKGKIWAESELGVGSTFYVVLPVSSNLE